ncbi:MAG: hypothetical protein L0I24_16575, partial [Pseudonocardia sp.]|nr:hypothetical protein [Pseudonocardia sp.]
IGRALLTNPRLMVLDEATEGLAPLIRQDIWNCLMGLKAEGEAILKKAATKNRALDMALATWGDITFNYESTDTADVLATPTTA